MKRSGAGLTVLVDTLSIAPRAGGIRVYLQQLLEHLPREDVSIWLVVSPPNRKLFEDLAVDRFFVVPWVRGSRTWRVLVQQLLVPLIALIHRPDLLYAPVDVAPVMSPVPIVTCVHSGLINLRRGVSRGLQARYLRQFVRWSLQRSRRVIAISEYVASMLAEEYPDVADRIQVVYHGGGLVEAAESAGWVPPPSGARDGGILFLGTLHPHKGVLDLVRAYSILRPSCDPAPSLIVAGHDPGGQHARIRAAACEAGIEEHVRLLGKVSNRQALQLLGNSHLLVFPSSSEGFGLPVLEAMRAETPVVAAARGSLPEIMGAGGLLVDPSDHEGMAEAMGRLLKDSEERQRVIDVGRRRSREFNWHRTSAETLEIWRDASR